MCATPAHAMAAAPIGPRGRDRKSSVIVAPSGVLVVKRTPNSNEVPTEVAVIIQGIYGLQRLTVEAPRMRVVD